MSTALKLLDKMAQTKKRAEAGYARWHQLGEGTQSAAKAYEQYLRNEVAYRKAEQELRALLAATGSAK
jgi:hypothetical protein